jgi:hypothetical protein
MLAMRDKAGETSSRLAQFVRGLYFELQSIEGVNPLEIWNGIREQFDPFEKTGLVKNLYKIVVPLANERCYGLPFPEHARVARQTVTSLLSQYGEGKGPGLLDRFPYPPTGSEDRKALYLQVKAEAAKILAGVDLPHPAASTRGKLRRGGELNAAGIFPDSLFDFREMRLVDNELPYIIFTDKEFRVIHGLVVVYLWLIDLDEVFLQTLKECSGTEQIIEEYRQLARRIRRENPLTIRGKRMDADQLLQHVHDKLKYEDYLDVFEEVYRWIEQREHDGAS